MAGRRCPGRAAVLYASCALGSQAVASPLLAAPRSTPRTSAVWSVPLSWQIRTADGCSFQSAAVHLISGEPVVYPAVCPLGRWGTLAWMASCPATTAMRASLCDALGEQV